MFPKSPLEPVRSPVVPVIWDRVRNQGPGRVMGTEGARPAGGGGRTTWIEHRHPTEGGERGWIKAEAPSGMRVSFERHGGNADVVFYPRGAMSMSPPPGGSTGRAIDRFGEVLGVMREYVTKYQPTSMTFIAGTPKHEPLYNRLLPHLAKQLGGTPSRAGKGMYKIIFPEVK